MIPSRASFLMVMILLTSWGFAAEIDPQNLSTGDLLFRYKDVKEYLDIRRQHLTMLREEIDSLDEQMIAVNASYFIANKMISGAKLIEGESSHERQELEDQLAEIREKSRALHMDVKRARINEKELANKQFELNSEFDDDEMAIATEMNRIGQLEREIELLNKAYDRSLRSKVVQILGDESS